MTTFKTNYQMRKEFSMNSKTLTNNGQVICESAEELERLASRMNHARRNTLTDRSFSK